MTKLDPVSVTLATTKQAKDAKFEKHKYIISACLAYINKAIQDAAGNGLEQAEFTAEEVTDRYVVDSIRSEVLKAGYGCDSHISKRFGTTFTVYWGL